MNDEQTWQSVDDFVSAQLGTDDATLKAALAASAQAGLPEIQVSAPQGKLLHLLAKMQGAQRILELGTLGGYSTIWLAPHRLARRRRARDIAPDRKGGRRSIRLDFHRCR
jgi:predicted O-methyltransferase YrrM